MNIAEKHKPKGQIRASVISLDAVGLIEFHDLKKRYASDPNRKHNLEYLKERAKIYTEHGFKKRRVTYNGKLFVTLARSFYRRRWAEAKELWRYEVGINHNIVTNEGDALTADLLAQTPAKTKVDNTNGHIAVGTGWTGTTPKTNTAVNTPTGSPEVMDATYPKLKGTFGNADDNVVQYRSTFEAGDLNISGIDEAGLGNNAVEATGDNLAYGEITPAVNVGSADTLQVDWEVTFTGA